MLLVLDSDGNSATQHTAAALLKMRRRRLQTGRTFGVVPAPELRVDTDDTLKKQHERTAGYAGRTMLVSSCFQAAYVIRLNLLQTEPVAPRVWRRTKCSSVPCWVLHNAWHGWTPHTRLPPS